ncbi:MAG TPA: hypothetical protein VFK70_15580 [Vicinamibacteria bacterium]|nr:hypothetical protein [Vicinamibacteria bacterium]
MIPELLRHALTHLGTRLFEGRLKKDALTPAVKDDGQDVWRLAFSPWFRAVWSVMTLLWSGSVVLFAWLWSEGELKWPLLLSAPMFLGLLAFSCVMVWDAWTQQLEVSTWGLTERRRGAVVATFPWTDVRRIAFVLYLDAYRVTPRQGKPVRVSMHLQGILRFKGLARTHAPEDAIEGELMRLSDLRKP